MSATDFKIKFDGATNEIDVNTLITSLVGLSAVIQDIQSKVKPDAKVEIKVKALEKGSFLILLGIHAPEILSAMKDLFTRENITLTAAILAALVHSITLKNFLKGTKAKSVTPESNGQDVRIENANGQTLVINAQVFNLYQTTPSIDRNLTKTFQAVSSDENITSLSITDNKETKLIEVPKSDFPMMTTVNEDIIDNVRHITKENVRMNAIKLSWERNIKWQFILEGNKINASISDDNFYSLIDRGEQFAKGDSIIADIKISQEFDESVNTYINKSYDVLRVKEHIPRSQQLDIDFE
jgi:hypothetical protein